MGDQNVQNLYPFSNQNGPNTIPFGVAHKGQAMYQGFFPSKFDTKIKAAMGLCVRSHISPICCCSYCPVNRAQTRQHWGRGEKA